MIFMFIYKHGLIIDILKWYLLMYKFDCQVAVMPLTASIH